MENLPVEPQLDDIPQMSVNAMSFTSLSETRRWALFFAILGIIGIVLMVLMFVVMDITNFNLLFVGGMIFNIIISLTIIYSSKSILKGNNLAA